MARRQPKKTFLCILTILVAVVSALLWWLGLAGLFAYLVGINAVTVLLYGYDKRQAIAGGGRVPEVILHLAALIGGSPGALLAQAVFRHKTQKLKFRMVFVGIVVVQVLAAFGYWHFVLRAS
ncbi:MAG: DUF1294 domain-containing protein [Phycisphaerae bacterium]|nr:DUF1294 domain-containing protein [Phycisphaerae bacterium]